MTRSAWWLFVDLLATYRLSRLVVEDDITEWLRLAVRARGWNPHEGGVIKPKAGRMGGFWRWLLALMTCWWCVSMWLAGLVVALTGLTPSVWQWPAAALAFSALVGLIAERN